MDHSIAKERTTLWVTLVAVLLIMLGITTVAVAAGCFAHLPWLQNLFSEVGSALLVAGVLTIVWDLAARRAFVSEIMMLAGLANEVRAAGLVRISHSYLQKEVDWGGMLGTGTELDVLVAYGRTWRNTMLPYLREFAYKGGVMRLCLPDPKDNVLVQELARRFGYAPASVQGEIAESISAFTKVFEAAHNLENLQIFYHNRSPVYSYYRVDHGCIVTLYQHDRDRADRIATMKFLGGWGAELFKRDFESTLRAARK